MPQRADNPAFNLLNRRAFFSKVGLTSQQGSQNPRPGLQACLAVEEDSPWRVGGRDSSGTA